MKSVARVCASKLKPKTTVDNKPNTNKASYLGGPSLHVQLRSARCVGYHRKLLRTAVMSFLTFQSAPLLLVQHIERAQSTKAMISMIEPAAGHNRRPSPGGFVAPVFLLGQGSREVLSLCTSSCSCLRTPCEGRRGKGQTEDEEDGASMSLMMDHILNPDHDALKHSAVFEGADGNLFCVHCASERCRPRASHVICCAGVIGGAFRIEPYMV